MQHNFVYSQNTLAHTKHSRRQCFWYNIIALFATKSQQKFVGQMGTGRLAIMMCPKNDCSGSVLDLMTFWSGCKRHKGRIWISGLTTFCRCNCWVGDLLPKQADLIFHKFCELWELFEVGRLILIRCSKSKKKKNC